MLHTVAQHCPYCGEPIELLIEDGAGDQHYIEDCQVCCRPMQVHVQDGAESGTAEGVPQVSLGTENEV